MLEIFDGFHVVAVAVAVGSDFFAGRNRAGGFARIRLSFGF